MARGNNGEPGDPHADLAGNHDPVDVSAVRRDDALLDAIASDGPVATDSPEEYQVAALLANWRAEIVAQPMPAGPDLDEIAARVRAELDARESLVLGSRSGRTRLRLLRPVAAAAALVAIAMGGMTVFSYNAQPGDPLWGVTQVVFTDRAASTEAKVDTTSSLEEAERLIATGDTAGAKAKLDSARERAGAVSEAGTRDQLNGWRERLLTELDKVAVPPPLESLLPEVPQSTVPLLPPPSSGLDSSTAGPGPESSGTVPGLPWPSLDPRLEGLIPVVPGWPPTPAPSTPSATPTPTPSVPITSSPAATPTSTPTATTTRATSGSVGGSPAPDSATR